MIFDEIDTSGLTDREIKIIKLRFGIDSGFPRTLCEVGRIFRVTKQRIMQLESKALTGLRRRSRIKAGVKIKAGDSLY